MAADGVFSSKDRTDTVMQSVDVEPEASAPKDRLATLPMEDCLLWNTRNTERIAIPGYLPQTRSSNPLASVGDRKFVAITYRRKSPKIEENKTLTISISISMRRQSAVSIEFFSLMDGIINDLHVFDIFIDNKASQVNNVYFRNYRRLFTNSLYHKNFLD
ncbi:hypothetical protein GAY31_06435 [Azospirillum brasilense]|nr:hypothetical protein [Azospirillum brasilense]